MRKLAGNMVVRGYGCTMPHVKQTGSVTDWVAVVSAC